MSLPQNPSICVPHVVQKLGLTDLWLQNGEKFSREPSCVCVQLDRRCPLNGSPAVCCLTAQEAALVAVPNFKGFLLPRAVSNCEFIAEISLFFFFPSSSGILRLRWLLLLVLLLLSTQKKGLQCSYSGTKQTAPFEEKKGK